MKNCRFRHFLVNMLCGVVVGKHRRRKIRVVLNTRFLSIVRFVKKDCGMINPKIKVIIGSRGRNLVINVSDKYVYKFRVAIDDFDDSFEKREYAITSVLSKVAPIYIPIPKIIKYEHGIARRYDFVSGINFKQLIKNEKYEAASNRLAKQLAEFIYKVSSVDPVQIRKYKQDQKQKTGYMLGWYHIDLFENFLIDENTFCINGIIDWEEVSFNKFDLGHRYSNLPVFDKFMKCVKVEYDRLYQNKEK